MKVASVACVTVLAAFVAAGCTASASDRDSAIETTSSSIRAMQPDEIVGQIIYGETLDVEYTSAPKYRAFWFKGERGDQIQAQVVSHDATDPILWLADADFNTLAINNDTRITDVNALLNGRILPKTGKYWLIFREVNSAPRASFSVTLRNLGRLPLDCDPDGEGIALPECIDPLEYEPFSPTSCAGTAMTAATANTKFGVTGGFRLPEGRVFYRSRQCKVPTTAGALPDCSPWVRAFGMDIAMVNIVKPAPGADGAAAPPNAYSFKTSSTTRKVNIDFSIGPTATTRFCVDGPYTNVRNTDAWTLFEDGTPGICGTATAVVNGTCARFEPKPIQLDSGAANYFTEFSAVLYARY